MDTEFLRLGLILAGFCVVGFNAAIFRHMGDLVDHAVTAWRWFMVGTSLLTATVCWALWSNRHGPYSWRLPLAAVALITTILSLVLLEREYRKRKGTMTHPAMIDGSFAHQRLGRKPVRHDPRTLQLADYLDEAVALPAVPATFDLASAVPTWPMYGNDRLGDCTWAALGHMVEGWTRANHHEVSLTTSTIVRGYWETGDPPAATGVAGGPTDDGRVELDVLNYWRHHGAGISGSHKIIAYAAVDPRNDAHMRAAIYLFGGVYTGIALPLTAQTQAVWDLVGDGTGRSAPGSWGGHAVPYLAYDAFGYTCVTWGSTLHLTTRFNDVYTEEAYAPLSADWLAKGVSPTGFNLAALTADLGAIH